MAIALIMVMAGVLSVSAGESFWVSLLFVLALVAALVVFTAVLYVVFTVQLLLMLLAALFVVVVLPSCIEYGLERLEEEIVRWRSGVAGRATR